MLLAALLLALLLRLPFAWIEMFHHPDEVWQYLEPAHGLLTGRQVVPWEYRAGIRSWLIPTLLAGPMAIGRAALPDAYLIPVRLCLVALSLVIVAAGAGLARRWSRLHAVVAALCLATAFELIYFSARALSDTIALAAVLPAFWLMRRDAADRRSWMAAGALLGLAAAIRFQLAPALLAAAAIHGRTDRLRWGLLTAGAVAGWAVAGLADVAQGAPPFLWVVRNFSQNVFHNRSAAYGVQPAWWYLVEQFRIWGWASLLFVPAIALGARREPGLLAVALVNVAVHSLIGHKEYRFVFLSSTLFTLLASIGIGDVLAGWRRRRAAGMAVAALLWLGGSAAVATSPAGREAWTGSRRVVAYLRAAASQPNACGLAVRTPKVTLIAAYTYYDRDTPIFAFPRTVAIDPLLRESGHFNVVIAPDSDASRLAPVFSRVACYPSKEERAEGRSPLRCLFSRPGPCAHPQASPFEINRVLQRMGE